MWNGKMKVLMPPESFHFWELLSGPRGPMLISVAVGIVIMALFCNTTRTPLAASLWILPTLCVVALLPDSKIGQWMQAIVPTAAAILVCLGYRLIERVRRHSGDNRSI